MRQIAFIVNIDSFFHSHRRQLQSALSHNYSSTVIAGDSGKSFPYTIKRFPIYSRIPTPRGLLKLKNMVNDLHEHTVLIVVSPVMIFLSHFIFLNRKLVVYNFSGLGYLRSNALARFLVFGLIGFINGKHRRVFVVQNKDDLDYLNYRYKSVKNFSIELVAGSGYELKYEGDMTLDFSEIKLGFVGRIRKDKGVLDLVRAVNQVKEEGGNIDLVVWGEMDNSRHGFSAQELNEIERNKRYFRGYSSNKEEIYSSFNCFCLPSNGEGLSKSAIEAASYGMPLVLSDVPGNRDMVSNNGILFTYSDVESLANALSILLGKSQRELLEMSNSSKQKFSNTWSMDHVKRGWLEILGNYSSSI